MRSVEVHCLAACAVAAILASGAAAADITAENAPPPNLSGAFNIGAGMGFDPPAVDPFDNRIAQTFVANVAGRPTTASFVASRIGNTTAPLWVDVVAMSGNQVLSVLASGSLPPATFGTDFLSRPYAFTVAPLTPVGELVAGQQYALIFRSATPDANYRIYGTHDNLYAEGETLRSQNSPQFEPMSLGSDVFFQVTVEPVPEPACSAMGTVCVAAVKLFRCRRGCRRNR